MPDLELDLKMILSGGSQRIVDARRAAHIAHTTQRARVQIVIGRDATP
jgi:hypothetical protein